MHATVDVGATLPWLGAAATVVLVGGLVLLGLGVVGIVLAVRGASRVEKGGRT